MGAGDQNAAAGTTGAGSGQLPAAGPLDGRIMLDAANSSGQQQLSLRSLADAFPPT